jgi:isochorismate hydrolase
VIKGTLRNCLNLIEAARIFSLPIMVTEHFSAVMGRSLPVVAESVLRLERENVYLCEKTLFSLVGERPLISWIKKTGRTQWVICGMEAHISIYQSARELVGQGYQVHVPRDAVVSRTMANWEIGLQLINRCGAVVTSTETVVFDLLKQAGTEEFNLLSKIVK